VAGPDPMDRAGKKAQPFDVHGELGGEVRGVAARSSLPATEGPQTAPSKELVRGILSRTPITTLFQGAYLSRLLTTPDIEISGIEHIYQMRLSPPYNSCRHAARMMAIAHLKSLGFSEDDIQEIFPNQDIYNGEVTSLLNRWPRRVKGAVTGPELEKLKTVTTLIDLHLLAGLPIPVYVSHHAHGGGLHVVLVTGRHVLDGKPVYSFLDPGTRGTRKVGELSFDPQLGNFIRPGSTGNPRYTNQSQYYLVGALPYLDRVLELDQDIVVAMSE